MGGTKDVDLWFVGPDCGNRGVAGTRVERGNEQEFGLRVAQTSGARTRRGRGARISTPCGSREHKFAWREEVAPLLPFWLWARYRSGRGDSVYVADGGKGGGECAEDMKIRLRALDRNAQKRG